jgi:hypothetical protein
MIVRLLAAWMALSALLAVPIARTVKRRARVRD